MEKLFKKRRYLNCQTFFPVFLRLIKNRSIVILEKKWIIDHNRVSPPHVCYLQKSVQVTDTFSIRKIQLQIWMISFQNHIATKMGKAKNFSRACFSSVYHHRFLAGNLIKIKQYYGRSSRESRNAIRK